MKTSEKIKKGLECCSNINTDCEGVCPYFMVEGCLKQCKDDALAYIQQLESRLAQVERERDAAVRAISIAQHYIKDLGALQYGLQQLEKWDYCIKQRGVCEENTKEERP